MKSLKLRVLLLVFVLSLAIGALLNGLSVGSGGFELQFPATLAVVSLIYSAILLWFGLQVSRYRQRQTRQKARAMNPLTAARTLLWAQTAAYVGAMFAGWHLALVVYQVNLFAVRSSWGPVWGALLGLLSGVLLLVVGIAVEGMCKIPPGDSDDEDDLTVSPRAEGKQGLARRRHP